MSPSPLPQPSRVRPTGERCPLLNSTVWLFVLLPGFWSCLPEEGDLTWVTHFDDSPTPGEAWMVKAERIVGASTSEEGDLLGWIEDVAFGPRDALLVIDSRMNELLVFNPDGDLQQRLRGPESGMGKFRSPRSIATNRASSEVLVLDRGGQRVLRYSGSDSILQFESEMRFPWTPIDLCVTGDGRVFVLGLTEERVIHEVDRNGGILRSFGAMYAAEEASPGLRRSLQHAMSTGSIECSDDPAHVFYFPKNQPFIEAFDHEGELIWESRLDDYYEIHAVFPSPGRMRLMPDSTVNASHQAINLRLVSGKGLVAQMGIRTLAAGDWFSVVETRILNPFSGEEVYRTREWPLLGGINGNLWWAWTNAPFPHVFAVDTLFPGSSSQ